jgi:D-aminopeptidase
MTRQRLRDLGLSIGIIPTGPANTISDVAGVSVGHSTIVRDEPRVARTGVTIINPRPVERLDQLCYGAIHSFNGNGEMTGSHWLAESGLVSGPIGITNTHQVGLVRDTLVAADPDAKWCLPIVGETYDGFLNDINAFHITEADVWRAIEAANAAGAAGSATVAEGNVGGGTGMICHGFKGGIGTSSRVVDTPSGTFTVGALVQANYGLRHLLRLDGCPVGQTLDAEAVPLPAEANAPETGSIIVVIATDAPLLADQCRRLAQRATVGLARVGSTGGNGSGDIFLAFATGNAVHVDADDLVAVQTLPAEHMSALFNAAAEAVEESIWNAMCAAETTTGFRGRTVHAVPLDRLVDAVRTAHGRRADSD